MLLDDDDGVAVSGSFAVVVFASTTNDDDYRHRKIVPYFFRDLSLFHARNSLIDTAGCSFDQMTFEYLASSVGYVTAGDFSVVKSAEQTLSLE